MSGDVQPRKRKDKKKKRDDESSHGVHMTKMGSEDVHLHVHEEHGTGGHWCAKLVFFSLMTILLGLVCLIIMENRGISDMDTPLSESRFSNYFDGWVDEHRADDHHDDTHGSLEDHDDEHDDEHDEPFEEEADVSEGEEADEEADEDENVTQEEAEEADHDDNVTAEDNDDDDEDADANATAEDEENVTAEEDENVTAEETENVTAEDENATTENYNDDEEDDNVTVEATTENTYEEEEDDEAEDDNITKEDDNIEENATREASKAYSKADDDDEDDVFDEDEDDGTFDSVENIVDNDAAELELLKEKARQQAAAEAKNNPSSVENNENDDEAVEQVSSWASSLTLKIGVGLALALVARLVLLKKNPITNDEDAVPAIKMQRRLTIASPEDDLPEDGDEIAEPLPENEIKPKAVGGGGPQSFEDVDDVFEQQLRRANEEMMQEHYTLALRSLNHLIQKYPTKPSIYLAKAQTLDRYAEQQKSNQILMESIKTYREYLDFKNIIKNETEYRTVAERCLNRIRFSGQTQQALPVHLALIDRFPNDSAVRNDLAVTYLILNRLSDAKLVLQETLKKWPNNGYALVHYGFVLKQLDHDYANAARYLNRGIESKAKGTQDGRFFFQLGEAYQRLGKPTKALEIYKKGAELKLFPSVYQRSLYNEGNLKAQPFWTLKDTTYEKYLQKLERHWKAIRNEGLGVLKISGYFQDEAENLKNKGEWKQFELYSRGQQIKRNCQKTPITCSIIAEFPAARDCSRGQVKFSVMHEGTHVWPHCGPTNCRLRAHLGLVVPAGTRLRVAQEKRSWTEGNILVFDDSFEHEVWHEGQGLRLILIVDIWHPDLTAEQRRTLHPI